MDEKGRKVRKGEERKKCKGEKQVILGFGIKYSIIMVVFRFECLRNRFYQFILG